MRTGNLGTADYSPSQAPNDPKALPAFLSNELRSIAAAIQLLAAGHIDKTNVAPTKPREGDIRLFDGTDYDPGSGAGVYAYYDAGAGLAWQKLG